MVKAKLWCSFTDPLIEVPELINRVKIKLCSWSFYKYCPNIYMVLIGLYIILIIPFRFV